MTTDEELFKWARDIATALLVGCVTFAFTVLLGGLHLRLSVFIVLWSVLTALLAATVALSVVVEHRMRREDPTHKYRLLDGLLVLVVPVFALLGFTQASATPWPLAPYTQQWWTIIAIAAFSLALGSGCADFSERPLIPR